MIDGNPPSPVPAPAALPPELPPASVAEFYKAQYGDMQDIWKQSWELAKIVLLVGGGAGTAIQALGSAHPFRQVAALAVSLLAFVSLLTQTSLGRRVVEKRNAIRLAEAKLGLSPLVLEIPGWKAARSRPFINTNMFLSFLHLSTSVLFLVVGLTAYLGHRWLLAVAFVVAVAEFCVALWLRRYLDRARLESDKPESVNHE